MEHRRLTIKEIAQDLDNKLPMHKCVVCGTQKVCMNYGEYAWKLNNRYCCSYSCFRVLEKKMLEKKSSKLHLMSK